MKLFPSIALICSAFLVSGCLKATDVTSTKNTSSRSGSRHARPTISQVLVDKGDGKMYLVSGKRKIRSYDIDLGFSPKGDKTRKGDGKTPEGTYYIDRKNPQSNFYLSLGISYPDQQDRVEAAQAGLDPGGNIFIHGQGRYGQGKSGTDWTWGCIAVTDLQIQEIYALVDVGTPITIQP